MLKAGRNELICDLAETYHVYDYRKLPVETLVAFCLGLKDDSRIKRKLAGLKCDPDTLLLAMIVDRLSLLVWGQSEDARKNRNRPKMIAPSFIETKKDESETKGFVTVEEFESAWKEIAGGNHGNNSTGIRADITVGGRNPGESDESPGR